MYAADFRVGVYCSRLGMFWQTFENPLIFDRTNLWLLQRVCCFRIFLKMFLLYFRWTDVGMGKGDASRGFLSICSQSVRRETKGSTVKWKPEVYDYSNDPP